MKAFLLVLASIALTALSWGVYGPLINKGQHGMTGADGSHSHLLPFMCVGVAYFLIAVVVPGLFLARGETGRWTVSGTLWSLGAGVAGAVGALGIILALTNGGSPAYVMPLVFGGAPVVNTFLTMFMSKTYGQAKPVFYAGLILVVAGACMVLVFKPTPIKPVAAAKAPAATAAEAATAASHAAPHALTVSDMTLISLFIGLTALSWGVYGPVLHKGQSAMAGSRLRPFLCVGVAYFLVAVLVPALLMIGSDEWSKFSTGGALWSLGGGAAGAVGALGIILAFNFGGRPIYVMPLVFGGAPVINTATTLLTAENLTPLTAPFYAGLMIVVAGAVTVLVFAPKPAGKPKPKSEGLPAAAGQHA